MTKDIAVFSIFDNKKAAQDAIRVINKMGFQKAKRSLLSQEPTHNEEFHYELFTEVQTGSAIGALVGGAVGLLLGFFVDKLPLFINAGSRPWMILTALTLFGIVFGAASGALVGIGTPEYLSRRYARYLNQGHHLLAVHVDNLKEAAHLREILYKLGAAEVVTEPEEATLQRVLRQKSGTFHLHAQHARI